MRKVRCFVKEYRNVFSRKKKLTPGGWVEFVDYWMPKETIGESNQLRRIRINNPDTPHEYPAHSIAYLFRSGMKVGGWVRFPFKEHVYVKNAKRCAFTLETTVTE